MTGRRRADWLELDRSGTIDSHVGRGSLAWPLVNLARGRRQAVLLLVLIATVVAMGGRPVSAHTDFESSSPADGETVDQGVAEVVITFTGEATPFGDGFTVLDPQGVVRGPTTVTTTDDKVFVLTFDPVLAGGVVGVRWHVQAQDAHPIEGSFSFTVAAPVPTTIPASTVPPTTVAESAIADPTTAATTNPATTTAETSTTAPVAVAGADSAGAAPSIEEFLATDSEVAGEGRQLAGRVIGYLGLVGAIGGLAFLGSSLRGTRRELRGGLLAVGILGLVTGLGAVIEYSGIVAQSDETFVEAWTSQPGVAAALRLLGGLAVAIGALVARDRYEGQPTRALSAAVVEDPDTQPLGSDIERWNPRSAPIALVGVGLIVASFWFDGHTVSRGPRIVHALVNSVHVLAASVWAGGVAALAITLWLRHRRREPSRAAALIVRFSSIATVALVAVVGAGLVMAIFVLDGVGELTSTEWGKILLLKTGAVGLAAAGGAYNHFRLRPALEASPDDEQLTAEFRSSLVAEAIVLAFVVVVTAWLVAAAS